MKKDIRKEIELSRVKVPEYNVRANADPDKLTGLMKSIKEEGLINPITVRLLEKSDEYDYELVCGHRRFFSMDKLGWKKCYATIKPFIEDKKDTEKRNLLLNMVENLQREDISAYDLGIFVLQLRDKHFFSIGSQAVKAGVPKSRLETAVFLAQRTPKQFVDKIGVFLGSQGRRIQPGKLAPEVAKRIIIESNRYKLTKKQTEEFFQHVLKHDLSSRHINIIAGLLKKGLDFQESLKKCSLYKVADTSFVIKKKAEKQLKKKYGTIRDFIYKKLEEEGYDTQQPLR